MEVCEPSNSETASNNNLKLFLANTRSLKGKTEELSTETYKFEIICLTETHIDPTFPNHQIFDYNNKTIYRHDRNIFGGGVLIAVNENLNSSLVEFENSDKTELVFVRIKKCIIGCYYRPQSQKSLTTLKTSLDMINKKFPTDHLILVGDMNIPGIDWHQKCSKPHTQERKLQLEFLNILSEANIHQLILEPTHIHGNTLDLICTSKPESIEHAVIFPGLSDHAIVTANIHIAHTGENISSPRTVKQYHKTDLEKFTKTLENVKHDLAKMNDVDSMWKLFSRSLQQAISDHVPVAEINVRQNANEPIWFNKESRKIAQKQRKLYNRYKHSKELYDKQAAASHKRLAKKTYRQIKKRYIEARVCKPLREGNSKPFYKHLKGMTQSRNQIALTSHDGRHTITDPKACADMLNNYFHQQFSTDHQLTTSAQAQVPSQALVPYITPDGVQNLIKTLKPGKAPGPDGFCKTDLSIDIIQTATCLSYIFNASLRSGKLPTDWKIANVSPLHKSGPKDSVKNYRPISLTSIPCKMLEHLVLRNLLEKIDKHLNNRQHGFRKGLSCETQLCATMQDILQAVDARQSIHTAVLDFTKAFDRVPHALLMQKLSTIADVDDYLLSWIHDFLINRTQQVVIRGNASKPLAVTSGVPQGSVLGPILFLVFINDLPDNLNCSVGLFADDTLLYQAVNNIEDAQRFQLNLDALSTWAERWGMSFNIAKSKIIAFNPIEETPMYTLNGSALEHVDSAKYLGVVLKSDCKFDTHINNKIMTAKKQLGMIKRALYWAPQHARLIAYKALCLPHLEYACAAWDPVSKKIICELENVQVDAIRFICNIRGRTDVKLAMEKLDLAPLSTRRRDKRICLLLQILSKEEHHPALSAAYENLVSHPTSTVQTRSQTRGIPRSLGANSSRYHNSFLPRTIRDMKITNQEETAEQPQIALLPKTG